MLQTDAARVLDKHLGKWDAVEFNIILDADDSNRIVYSYANDGTAIVECGLGDEKVDPGDAGMQALALLALADLRVCSMRTAEEVTKLMDTINLNTIRTARKSVMEYMEERIPITRAPDGKDGASISLPDVLRFLVENDVLRIDEDKRHVVGLTISGDGFMANSGFYVQICVSIPALRDRYRELGVPVTLSCLTMAVYRGEEKAASIMKFMEPLVEEVKELKRDGLKMTKDGKTRKVKFMFLFCGDAKFTKLSFGLMTGKAYACCYLCTVLVGNEEVGFLAGVDLAEMMKRTAEKPGGSCHAQCPAGAECDGIGILDSGGEEYDGRPCIRVCSEDCSGLHGYVGVLDDLASLVREVIGFDFIIPDLLHLKMRCVSLLWRAVRFLFMSWVRSRIGVALGDGTDVLRAFLVGKSLPPGYASLTSAAGFKGTQVDVVLEPMNVNALFGSLREFVMSSAKVTDAPAVRTIMSRTLRRLRDLKPLFTEFRTLVHYMNTKEPSDFCSITSPDDFATRAKTWATSLLTLIGTPKETVYVHLLVSHVGPLLKKFGPLGPVRSGLWMPVSALFRLSLTPQAPFWTALYGVCGRQEPNCSASAPALHQLP